jgi:hypothetical protein
MKDKFTDIMKDEGVSPRPVTRLRSGPLSRPSFPMWNESALKRRRELGVLAVPSYSSVQTRGVRRNTTNPIGFRPPGGDEDTKSQPLMLMGGQAPRCGGRSELPSVIVPDR